MVSPAFAFGYPGTCRVGRLSSLIAFAMSAPPIYSLWQFLQSAARPAGGGEARVPVKALQGGPNQHTTGQWSEEEDQEDAG